MEVNAQATRKATAAAKCKNQFDMLSNPAYMKLSRRIKYTEQSTTLDPECVSTSKKEKHICVLAKKKRETRKDNNALVVLAGTRKESLPESTQNSIKN